MSSENDNISIFQKEKIKLIKEGGRIFADHIRNMTPDSKDQEMALLKLDEAIEWAIKGVKNE